MDMFDQLTDKGINSCFITGVVSKDIIRKKFEDRYEEIEISDFLRLMVNDV